MNMVAMIRHAGNVRNTGTGPTTQDKIENYVIIIHISFCWYPSFKFILWSAKFVHVQAWLPPLYESKSDRDCLWEWKTRTIAATTTPTSISKHIIIYIYIETVRKFMHSVNEMPNTRCAPLFSYVICLIGSFYRRSQFTQRTATLELDAKLFSRELNCFR